MPKMSRKQHVVVAYAMPSAEQQEDDEKLDWKYNGTNCRNITPRLVSFGPPFIAA